MFLKFILLISVSGSFGHTDRKQFDVENLPQQWEVLVTFVNQKIEGLERLVTTKDERVDQLESDLASQKTEIAQLTQRMAALKRAMSQKDVLVDRLVNTITDLEKIVMVDYISPKRDPRPVKSNMDSNTSLTDIRDRPQSSNNKQLIRARLPMNETRGTPHINYKTSYLTSRVGNVPYSNPHFIEASPTQTEKNEEVSSISKEPRSRQNRVAPPSPSPKTTVAFHVTLTDSSPHTPDTTVVYGHEVLDQGDGYSPGDGIYIAPESGTYVFTWTTICEKHNYFQTVLVVNGAVRGSSWTESADVNDYHQTTAVVILVLNQGDHVFIRMGHTYGQGTIVNYSTVGSSTFSGWKLD